MKNGFLLLLVSFLSLSVPVWAVSYIYPVGVLEYNKTYKLFLIYQEAPDQIGLYMFDPNLATTCKVLSGYLNPAACTVLPDMSGFSFVDTGRIRIKKFGKKRVASVDLYQPLYNITQLVWIDAKCCIVSAQEKGYYGLYHIYTKHNVTVPLLKGTEEKEFLYPQKQGNLLFYIERRPVAIRSAVTPILFYSKLMCVDYALTDTLNKNLSNIPEDCTYTHERDSLFDASSCRQLFDFGRKSVVFLQMISTKKGFIIEHPSYIDNEEQTVTCTYHSLIQEVDTWVCKPLFSFGIPTALLFDTKERLYESLLPLLPVYYDEKIYYSDCTTSRTHTLELFSFDLKTEATNCIATHPGVHFFKPCVMQNTLYYGQSMSTGTSMDQIPSMEIPLS